MDTPLRVGDILYGNCGGNFKYSHDDKRVEAIGSDWVVCRDEYGKVHIYEGKPEILCDYRT